MKRNTVKAILFKLFFICLALSNFNALAQKTTIYIVRHAEKAANPADDPDLTSAGQKRAKDLIKALKREKIAGIYVTNYKRVTQTAKPTADKFTLMPEKYDPTDLKAFAKKVYQYYSGHSVLIVGHSNTVIPTLVALGGPQPFNTLTDDDYDMLFKLTIKDGKPELEISYYGEPHHTTMIPEQYLGYTTEHFVKPPVRF
ncbi:histidine phosphatase family protein [Mucilaginibacter mali]|uniref:Histidine phosphatase family protein n=1 Tax=Mucilaginibacter mali TaxID=2740462 RepID=A0A7D4UCJ8_9SPHI|nr:phosphoglycerate mutase family protein [Mucilaginibacter mali]QKJ31758.1 histidine phosphatase family protein [Mucilaginibacter mali]